ncbi:MAG TPA: DUF2252 domain-containing protein [Gemmatimonadaceae bacterium]|nr:DUF2252 domain-containing protein [Gemmatimonadaceae bacterium]
MSTRGGGSQAAGGHGGRSASAYESDRFERQYAAGKALRAKVPRESHAAWAPAPARPDPVRMLEQSSEGRVPELLPIRYGRMVRTPFAFYRGAAAIMAHDLSTTPASGIRVQCAGDCHLVNFGGFATPERKLIFDINDFDETLPAPWEWDLKRLAASFVIAARDNGFKHRQARAAALACAASYRKRMARYAASPILKVWYATISAEDAISATSDVALQTAERKRVRQAVARSVPEDDFPKLTEERGGNPVIKDNAPLIFHPHGEEARTFRSRAEGAFAGYRASLADDRRALLDRYHLVDVAMKVVGVGSVGTRCGVLLLMAGRDDPLFLQVKEARASVLEPYAGKSGYENRGERVVAGQRLMQSASDIFLGWTETEFGHFYVRQLRDAKIKPLVATYSPSVLAEYGTLCGWALARAHAKAGDAALIAGYVGRSDVLDEAITDFAVAYADQNASDHAAFKAAVRAGRIEVRLDS